MKKLLDHIKNLTFALKILFIASPKYFMCKLIVSFIVSLLPYTLVILWGEIIDTLGNNGTSNSIIEYSLFLGIGYCFILVAERFFNIIMSSISYKFNDEIDFYLDNVMIEKVSHAKLAFFDLSSSKNTLTNSWQLIDSIKDMLEITFGMCKSIIGLLTSIWMISELGIFIIIIMILFSIPSLAMNKIELQEDNEFRKDHILHSRKMEYYKDLFFNDARYEVKVFQLKDHFLSLYDNEWREYFNAQMVKDKRLGMKCCLSIMVSGISEFIILIYVVIKQLSCQLSAGNATYFVLLAKEFNNSFVQLFYNINRYLQNIQQIDDIRSFIELDTMLEKYEGEFFEKRAGQSVRVEFSHVSFKYPNSEDYVLKDCSFTIEPGETVGLVGVNGSGKSTIVKLLLRLYEPCEGKIFVNNIDYKEYDIVKFRALFGILFQDHMKYSFSLRENVAIADINRMYNDSEIIAACTESNVLDFMQYWENGIDENLTRLFDENGKELSGGQWQRVALARAYFRKASCIILDEPSSSIDAVTENEIFEKLTNLIYDKNALLISHRLSNLINVNKIILLDKGRIIEQGTHEELLKLNGRYAYLFNLQSKKFKLK